MNSNRAIVSLIGLSIVGATAIGCSSANSPALPVDTNAKDACYAGTPLGESMARLYEASIDAGEKSVTVYGPAATNWEPVVEGFNGCFPDITVELVSMVGPELLARVQAEFTSGQVAGDVIFGPLNNGAFLPDQDDWFTPFEPEGGGALPHHEDKIWYAPYAALFGFAYNSDNVSKDELPRDYDDLLDERWKDKIALSNPSTQGSGSATLVLAELAGRIDDEWMTEFGANELVIVPDAAAVSQSLVSGRTDIAIHPMSLTKADQRKGAPIEFVPELAILSHIGVGILDGAPNPEAAKLLVSWMLTERGQADFAAQGQYSLMPGAPLPEGITEHNHTANDLASSDEALEAWKHVLEFWTASLS